MVDYDVGMFGFGGENERQETIILISWHSWDLLLLTPVLVI